MLTLVTPEHAATWLRAQVHANAALRSDSRALQAGDAFIAVPGQRHDARRFVAGALAAGAAACLVEAQGVAAFGFDDPRIAALPGLKAASGHVADAYYGQPSARLDVIASTGTNGKTSTAWWMAQALGALGRRCGVVGTLGVGEPPPAKAGVAGGPGHVTPTGLTTPDAVSLHAALCRFADQGFAACALEASSIGIVEHRLAGVRVKLALFTNFTRDHLDFHGDMATYWAAKRALFDWPGLQAAVVNTDDAQGAELATQLTSQRHGMQLDLWTVSSAGPARLRAANIRHTGKGLTFDVCEGGHTLALTSQLVGPFNASNLLVVLAGLRALGVPLADAVAVAAQLTPVPGRLQRVALDSADGADIDVLVDYAHTPDALQRALDALRPLAAARGGKLWCVFGCGGNRDATKRPLMGAIAAAAADRVVITSDNPRDEAPGAILAQILAGVVGHGDVDVIEDRREAIAHAVRSACSGDVLLLAGKGHEAYQEIAGIQRQFSDAQEALAALRLRAHTHAGAGVPA